MLDKPTIEERFQKFHAENPDIYRLLLKFGRQVIGAGYDKYSIDALFQQIRWHVMIETKRENATSFKLNDHFRSRYARLIMEREPDFANFFEIRDLREGSGSDYVVTSGGTEIKTTPTPPTATIKETSIEEGDEPPIIRAIQVYYKGFKFRSKLEAQWAIFLDALGLEWVYEPSGYHLSDGRGYIPDFWIYNLGGGMFLEVKPRKNSDISKSKRLAKDTGKRVWLGIGAPASKEYPVLSWNESIHDFDIDTIDGTSFIKSAISAATKARSYRFDRPQDNESNA